MQKKVVVIGPNLPAALAARGSFHVHVAGCADIQKTYRRYADPADLKATINIESAYDVMVYVYPPSDFGYDPEDREDNAQYLNDIYIAPCVMTNVPVTA